MPLILSPFGQKRLFFFLQSISVFICMCTLFICPDLNPVGNYLLFLQGGNIFSSMFGRLGKVLWFHFSFFLCWNSRECRLSQPPVKMRHGWWFVMNGKDRTETFISFFRVFIFQNVKEVLRFSSKYHSNRHFFYIFDTQLKPPTPVLINRRSCICKRGFFVSV